MSRIPQMIGYWLVKDVKIVSKALALVAILPVTPVSADLTNYGTWNYNDNLGPVLASMALALVFVYLTTIISSLLKRFRMESRVSGSDAHSIGVTNGNPIVARMASETHSNAITDDIEERDHKERDHKKRDHKLEQLASRDAYLTRELNQSNRELEIIYELSTDVVCISDLVFSGYLKKVNPAFSRMLGYSSEYLLSMPYSDLVHPKDRAETDRILSEQLTSHQFPVRYENRLRDRDGNYCRVSWITKTILDQGTTISIGRALQTRSGKLNSEVTERNSPALTPVADELDFATHDSLAPFQKHQEARASYSPAAVNEADMEIEFIDYVCQVLIDMGGYKTAWVALIDNGGKSLHPVSFAGPADHTTQANVKINTVCMEMAAEALRRQATVTRESINDRDLLNRNVFTGIGYRNHYLIAIPLKSQHGIVGVLVVSSDNQHESRNEEVQILHKMAYDLSESMEKLHNHVDEMEVSERLSHSLRNTIAAIALTAQKRDPYTAGHQNRVAHLAGQIARNLHLPGHQIEGIELGASIHDIGKIYIPSEVLSRPGKLSREEFDLIKTHPIVGCEIVKDIEFPWPIANMILQHHEKLDGSGYPYGISGNEICFEAQILTVADVIEAIYSHRPYRPSLGLDSSTQILLEGRNKLFNSDIVDACIEIVTAKDFQFMEVNQR